MHDGNEKEGERSSEETFQSVCIANLPNLNINVNQKTFMSAISSQILSCNEKTDHCRCSIFCKTDQRICAIYCVIVNNKSLLIYLAASQ